MTTEQLDIFTAAAPTTARKTPLEAAAAWKAKHPDAWRYMASQAMWRAERGLKFSMRALVEYVRWHFQLEHPGESYAIDGNAVPAMARLLVAEHPELREYVEMRRTGLDGGSRTGDAL